MTTSIAQLKTRTPWHFTCVKAILYPLLKNANYEGASQRHAKSSLELTQAPDTWVYLGCTVLCLVKQSVQHYKITKYTGHPVRRFLKHQTFKVFFGTVTMLNFLICPWAVLLHLLVCRFARGKDWAWHKQSGNAGGVITTCYSWPSSAHRSAFVTTDITFDQTPTFKQSNDVIDFFHLLCLSLPEFNSNTTDLL